MFSSRNQGLSKRSSPLKILTFFCFLSLFVNLFLLYPKYPTTETSVVLVSKLSVLPENVTDTEEETALKMKSSRNREGLSEFRFYYKSTGYQSLDLEPSSFELRPCNKSKVVIMTPLKNAAGHLSTYLASLIDFDYPKECLSIGFLVSDSSDTVSTSPAESSIFSQLIKQVSPDIVVSGTLFSALKICRDLLSLGYRRATVSYFDEHLQSPDYKRSIAFQAVRRGAMARARNHLIQNALVDEDYAFWMDSDINRVKPHVFSTLMSFAETGHGLPGVKLLPSDPDSGAEGTVVNGVVVKPQIVVPNCVFNDHCEDLKDFSNRRTFDMNTWKMVRSPGDSASAKEVIDWFRTEMDQWVRQQPQRRSEDLWLQGYPPDQSPYGSSKEFKYPSEMRSESGHLHRTDAVGGTALLVDADLHRRGLVFPVAPYKHTIETEGLALAALDFGVTAWVLPHLYISHC